MGLKGTDPGGRLGPSHSELRKRHEKQGPHLDLFPHLCNWLSPGHTWAKQAAEQRLGSTRLPPSGCFS